MASSLPRSKQSLIVCYSVLRDQVSPGFLLFAIWKCVVSGNVRFLIFSSGKAGEKRLARRTPRYVERDGTKPTPPDGKRRNRLGLVAQLARAHD
jgi:hypothetical protein